MLRIGRLRLGRQSYRLPRYLLLFPLPQSFLQR
jgi:hypothetical protein